MIAAGRCCCKCERLRASRPMNLLIEPIQTPKFVFGLPANKWYWKQIHINASDFTSCIWMIEKWCDLLSSVEVPTSISPSGHRKYAWMHTNRTNCKLEEACSVFAGKSDALWVTQTIISSTYLPKKKKSPAQASFTISQVIFGWFIMYMCFVRTLHVCNARKWLWTTPLTKCKYN